MKKKHHDFRDPPPYRISEFATHTAVINTPFNVNKLQLGVSNPMLPGIKFLWTGLTCLRVFKSLKQAAYAMTNCTKSGSCLGCPVPQFSNAYCCFRKGKCYEDSQASDLYVYTINCSHALACPAFQILEVAIPHTSNVLVGMSCTCGIS